MQQFKLKSESVALAQALASLGMALLVLFGIGGTIYRMIAPGGWLARFLDSSLSPGAMTVAVVLALGLLSWIASNWSRRSFIAEGLVMLAAFAGFIYVVQFFGH